MAGPGWGFIFIDLFVGDCWCGLEFCCVWGFMCLGVDVFVLGFDCCLHIFGGQ